MALGVVLPEQWEDWLASGRRKCLCICDQMLGTWSFRSHILHSLFCAQIGWQRDPLSNQESTFYRRIPFQVSRILWKELCGWLNIPESCIPLHRGVKALLDCFGVPPCHKCSASSCSREPVPPLLRWIILTPGAQSAAWRSGKNETPPPCLQF